MEQAPPSDWYNRAVAQAQAINYSMSPVHELQRHGHMELAQANLARAVEEAEALTHILRAQLTELDVIIALHEKEART